MASHHHPCHHATTPAASCYCYYCYPTYTPCHHHHPPPPPEPHLHHPPHLYFDPPHLPNLPQYQENYFQEGRQTYPTVSSLLRRIAALESALHRRSSDSSSSRSLRDAAARTIQTHFRAFLVRRSRTVRQLKDLASIKSMFGILKSSVSEKTHFDSDVVYHKAMNLRLKLDTIQGADPMIRNGKGSISRELNKFLNFLEGFCVENVRYSRNTVKSMASNSKTKVGNVKYGDSKRVNVEKLSSLVERIDKLAEEQDEVIENANNNFMIRKRGVSGSRTGVLVKKNGGVQPKVKKNVSFVENGKVYRVSRRHNKPVLEEYCDDSIIRDSLADAAIELEDDLCREIGISSKVDDDDDEGEDHQSENEGSLPSIDGEIDSRIYPMSESNFERKRQDQDDTDDFIFCAPLPVKMVERGE